MKNCREEGDGSHGGSSRDSGGAASGGTGVRPQEAGALGRARRPPLRTREDGGGVPRASRAPSTATSSLRGPRCSRSGAARATCWLRCPPRGRRRGLRARDGRGRLPATPGAHLRAGGCARAGPRPDVRRRDPLGPAGRPVGRAGRPGSGAGVTAARSTRVVINAYSRLWQPILEAARTARPGQPAAAAELADRPRT